MSNRTLNPLANDGPAKLFIGVELRRLTAGLDPDEPPQGVSVDVHRVRIANAEDGLGRLKSLMTTICEVSTRPAWPKDDDWLSLLPNWFLEACPDPTSAVERARQIESDGEGPYVDELDWQLTRNWEPALWGYWMAPDRRQWIWWSAQVEQEDELWVAIDKLGDWDPQFPGEFVWMLRAMGASLIERVSYPEAARLISSQ